MNEHAASSFNRHFVATRQAPDSKCILVKSGTDFREFSVLELNHLPKGGWTHTVQRVEVTAEYEEDPKLKQELQHFIGEQHADRFTADGWSHPRVSDW